MTDNGTEQSASLAVYYDDVCLAHEAPDGEFEAEWSGRLAVREPHPDRPERIRNVRSIIEHELGEHTTWESVEPASVEALSRVHETEYVRAVEAFSDAGGGRYTPETGGNEATYEAARYAAGAARDAALAALEADVVPYALVRPSGHHAQSDQADGYCFFNNAAVAAEAALTREAVDEVAILDWDVHHGNGTQEIFFDRDDVLVVNLHNAHWSWNPDTHPQSGDVAETGDGAGDGYNVNVPLPPGTGDEGYRYALERIVEPIVGAFGPDLLLISAGADPGTIDPLGRNVVTKAGFESLGAYARALAADYAEGNIALIQEGGYQISHLPYATLGVLEGVLGVDTGVEDPFAWLDEDLRAARRTVDDVAATHAAHWPIEGE